MLEFENAGVAIAQFDQHQDGGEHQEREEDEAHYEVLEWMRRQVVRYGFVSM